MSATLEPQAPERRWSIGWVIALVVAVLVLVGVGVVVSVIWVESGRDVPQFPSLVDDPDPTLQGTIAYTDVATGCVRVIAVSGVADKEVYCPDQWSVEEAARLGKPVGPQLVWLEDGRLEVTWFRMADPPGPDLRAGWQVVVDVRTGDVEEIPDDQAPGTPNLETRPSTSPDGVQIGYITDSRTGRVEVSLTEPDGTTKVLLSDQGPGGYTYGLRSVFWSPDYEWLVVDDGRILIITFGEPGLVRVLVDQIGGGLTGGNPAESTFAVTADNLL